MDLLSLFKVLNARKWLLLISAVIGVLLAVLATYNIEVGRGHKDLVRLRPKSYTTYSTSISLMINDPQFSLGRAGNDPTKPGNLSRIISLAPTYAELAISEPMMREVLKKTGKVDAEISSEPVKDSPVFEVSVKGKDPQHIRVIADAIGSSFIDYLERNQVQHKVPKDDRIYVQVLTRPDYATAEKSRNLEMAVLAFLTPIVLAVFLAFTLHNLRLGRKLSEYSTDDEIQKLKRSV